MNLELTPQECRLLIFSLGATARFDLDMVSIVVGGKIDPINLVRRLAELHGNSLHLPLEPNGAQGTNLPGQQAGNDEQLRSRVSDGRPQSDNQPKRHTQIPPIDRWSQAFIKRNVPADAEQLVMTPGKIERKKTTKGDPMLSVRYENPTGRGFLSASVFDEELFVWVNSRIKTPTTFFVTKTGKYTNIVGLRA